MQAKKFDYNALKLEYFQSNIDEIKWFWIEKGLKYNSQVGEHTKWRWKEKQARKDKIVEDALERQKKKISKELEIPIEDLFKIKKQVVDLMKRKLKKTEDDEEATMNMKELEKIRKVAKVELWEPTIVAKNEWKTTIETTWPLVAIIRSEEDEDDEEENDDE